MLIDCLWVISMLDETRRSQKTRKTTAKMGVACEERSEKGREGRRQLRWE